MQGFFKSVIYTVHHPVHVYNILVSAIFFFCCFFHSFIGCSSSDIHYKFVIQHTHTHTHKKKKTKKQLPGFENGFERHFYNFKSTLQIFIFFELIEGHTFSVPVNSLKQGIM